MWRTDLCVAQDSQLTPGHSTFTWNFLRFLRHLDLKTGVDVGLHIGYSFNTAMSNEWCSWPFSRAGTCCKIELLAAQPGGRVLYTFLGGGVPLNSDPLNRPCSAALCNPILDYTPSIPTLSQTSLCKALSLSYSRLNSSYHL